MNEKLLFRLRKWRAEQAARAGVEVYRVLPNAALEAIALTIPANAQEFLRINGIKEGRFKKYGAALLTMVSDYLPEVVQDQGVGGKEREVASDEFNVVSVSAIERMMLASDRDGAENTDSSLGTLYTVSAFLDALNDVFAPMTMRVRGEISSIDERERAIYFTLKDTQDQSTLNVVMFRFHYEMSGIRLAIGQEVIAEGAPDIWKPTGRLSLKAKSVEWFGEGALQKAYNELRTKLEKEGMFDESKKRALPKFPERIALITSSQGAAIGDFMMNLEKRGFRVTLVESSVEGGRAVSELLRAIEWCNRHAERFDIAVIMRGGGSLESLQAFNNEHVTRAVATLKLPTLCGIGHEKDVTLAAMVADRMVSTPTATALALCEGYKAVETKLLRAEKRMLEGFSEDVHVLQKRIDRSKESLIIAEKYIVDRFGAVERKWERCLLRFEADMQSAILNFGGYEDVLKKGLAERIRLASEKIVRCEQTFAMHNPERLLKLGYSLVFKDGRLIRSVSDAVSGEHLSIRVSDGSIDTIVR